MALEDTISCPIHGAALRTGANRCRSPMLVSTLEEAARLASEISEWSPEERQRQIEAYRMEIDHNFRPHRASTSEIGAIPR